MVVNVNSKGTDISELAMWMLTLALKLPRSLRKGEILDQQSFMIMINPLTFHLTN